MTANVNYHIHFPGNQGAVLFSTDLQGVPRRITAVIIHILFTGLDYLNRLTRLQGQGNCDENNRVGVDARAEVPSPGYAFNVYLV